MIAIPWNMKSESLVFCVQRTMIKIITWIVRMKCFAVMQLFIQKNRQFQFEELIHSCFQKLSKNFFQILFLAYYFNSFCSKNIHREDLFLMNIQFYKKKTSLF